MKEIALILNQIPREMLLLLKTNELLRGIETNLKTRASSSSFIDVTKICIKTVNSYERELFYNELAKSDQLSASIFSTLFELAKFNFFSGSREFIDLFKIYTFQIFLALFNF